MFPPSPTSHANYSSICSPSPHHTSTPLLPSFLSFPLLSSRLLSCPLLFSSSLINSSSSPLLSSSVYAAIGGWHRPQLAYSTFNLSLISLHCNGKWFCVLLFDWSCKPAPHHRGTLCLGVGGVFNFALAQIVFYQRIHISNLILHINQAVCKWPNKKIGKSGEQ